MSEIQVGLARITRVEILDGHGIFLDVDMLGYMQGDGTPLPARVRWCPTYAGPGYGEWHVPEVDRAVLCIFPGAQPNRDVGGDIGEGFAFAFSSFTDAPPIDGVDAPLSATTRVFRGQDGVNEDRETRGTLVWYLRAAAQWLCDAVQTLTGTQILIVSGDVRIGSASVRKLCDERLITYLASHTHSGVQPGGGVTGAPVTAPAVGSHTTTHTKAS